MERLPTYEQLYASFRWNIPARYNIAADVCDRHAADPSKVALIGEAADGKAWQMTFRDVQRKANQLANLFVATGLVKSDRVMLLLGQNPWTAIAHVACWKAGLVSVPVSTLFAADAVAYRLNLVSARILITDQANLPTALRTLTDVGYFIVDYFFTPRCIELGDLFVQKMARIPRQLSFALAPDVTVRVLGGYSLMVLAE